MIRNLNSLFIILVFHLAQPMGAASQVQPKVALLGSCRLLSGAQIPNCRIAYRTFGRLNAARDNTVLIGTWLLGRSEEWESLVGSEGILDTTALYVVVVDALGNGRSSSPSNTVARARNGFPGLTIGDMVVSQHRLLHEHLGIKHLRAVLGFSMGGMHAFEWAVRYPNELDLAIPIAGSPRVGAYDRLLWTKYLDEIEGGRQARMKPELIWLRISRLETMVLRTPSAVNRESWDSVEAQIESGAASLAQNWKLEDFAAQLHAIQRYDVSDQTGGDLTKAVAAVRARMLIISFPQDHIVTPGPSQAFARLVRADTLSVTSDCGHVTLWCERAAVAAAIQSFLSR